MVCFNSHGFFFADQPMTIGDYLLYPDSRADFETRLMCESIKRADIRKSRWGLPAHTLEPWFPRFEEHEKIHSDQWEQYSAPPKYIHAYLYEEMFPPNDFEVGANLWWGGYRVQESGSPTTGIRQGCGWLY